MYPVIKSLEIARWRDVAGNLIRQPTLPHPMFWPPIEPRATGGWFPPIATSPQLKHGDGRIPINPLRTPQSKP